MKRFAICISLAFFVGNEAFACSCHAAGSPPIEADCSGGQVLTCGADVGGSPGANLEGFTLPSGVANLLSVPGSGSVVTAPWADLLVVARGQSGEAPLREVLTRPLARSLVGSPDESPSFRLRQDLRDKWSPIFSLVSPTR